MAEPLKKKIKITDKINLNVKQDNYEKKKQETSRLYVRRNALWNIYVIKLLLVLHFSLHF
jgi:hypothetical protein